MGSAEPSSTSLLRHALARLEEGAGAAGGRDHPGRLYDEESARKVLRALRECATLFRELLARLEAAERQTDGEAGPGGGGDV